jgi:hypothetical protein
MKAYKPACPQDGLLGIRFESMTTPELKARVTLSSSTQNGEC